MVAVDGEPSIVIGLFVYAIIVAKTRTFSGYAGVIALALIVVPVVVRTTENMLQLIPNALREAAVALGSPKWVMIWRVTLKAARAGVVTGVLLALARIAGETAPLLFTALSNQFFSLNLAQPMSNLPVTIFKFAMSPFANWQELAWAGVFLITVGVLVLNILFVLLFYKELKISAFDPELATTVGINASVMHYALMVMVAITTVANFEAVGSILVIAMLIVPGVAAHLLTDKMGLMIAISLLAAIASAIRRWRGWPTGSAARPCTRPCWALPTR